MPLPRTADTAGDHIDWITTSPEAIRFTDSSKVFQKARNWPSFLVLIRKSMVLSISALVMLPLSPYLMMPADSQFIACSVFAGKTFLHIQYSISPTSNELGCVTTRCTTASESSAVICRVMPRSALHFSAISLIADTPVPH